jgi:hypothetical protein
MDHNEELNITPDTDVLDKMPEQKPAKQKKQKHHLIKSPWLRIPFKCVMWLFIFILLIPVMLYIPPVQRAAVKVAGDYVEKSTGMRIGIGFFRLSFPLDVHLDDVYVLEASRDTMVRAEELVADVKLMPLLKLDVKLNKLKLNNGYYHMVNADSSMVMSLRAGLLEVDDKSSANLADMNILLNKAYLKDGDVSVYMNVWKQKHEEDTTESTPIKIIANELKLENFRFGMSMLPTIDTLNLAANNITLNEAKIDLGENVVQWKLAAVDTGKVTFLTPDPAWAKAHPAPESEPSNSAPMRIMGDSISLNGFDVLYATKGVKPAAGFDASYISLSGVGIAMKDFYNESSTIKLPITKLQAKERCGLTILSGNGTVAVDSVGIVVDNLNIKTLYSSLHADADVPFALMSMDPNAAMSANAYGSIGLPDVDAFMPDLKTYTKLVPARKPLQFKVEADGSLSDITISALKAKMEGVLSLDASGYAKNPLQYKKMKAALKFNGSLSNPSLADKFLAPSDFKVPAFTIKGDATANGLAYGANFTMKSTAGDLAAVGKVALTPETYTAEIHAVDINVGQFMPSLGIGTVTADVNANGSGFNPLSGKAVTNADIFVKSIVYNKQTLRDIAANLQISPSGGMSLIASSPNPGLDFDIEGSGSILPDDYTFDVTARLRDVDLWKLGITDTLCSGSGDIYIAGTASPEKWLYDVDMQISDLDWNLPDQYIHLPGGVSASVKADIISTAVYLNSQLTDLAFTSDAGLQHVIDSFTKVADLAMKQVDHRSLAVDSLSNMLPNFDLKLNASGRGLLQQFLTPQGMSVDTVYAYISRDSLITGNIGVRNFDTGSLKLDTVTMTMKERGSLLDYQVHMGNRPGTLDEFAKVNLRGYVGNNRLSAYLTQQNIKDEIGYRIGLTAALVDSVASVHITPLKATIAYMPWSINDDNYIDFNLYSKKLDANLTASSKESSIMVKTEPDEDGIDQHRLKIDNLKIEDFIGMWAFAPPVTGAINADLKLAYDGSKFSGKGALGVQKLTYEKKTIGNLDMDLDADYGLDGTTNVNAGLKVNGDRAMNLFASLLPEEGGGMKADSVGVSLTRFPLKIANPFLGQSVQLAGYLNGDMRMDGTFVKPLLNGKIMFDSVVANIPIMAASLKFGEDEVKVADNVVSFKDFNIFGANNNPLSLNGTVNATNFSKIIFNLNAAADNMQLIKSDKRSKGDLFGKIFLTMNADVKGPLNFLDINGNVNILGNTDATYRLNMTTEELQATTTDSDIVKFVNLNDSTATEREDSTASAMNMRINANVSIAQGTKMTVLLSNNGTDKVEINPSAQLRFSQSYMGDMTLNGTLTLGQGVARYTIPVVGEKAFDIDAASNLVWNGKIMNPTINVTATDEIKSNVTSSGSSRLVTFLVTLKATNTLEQLNVAFDLSTSDDVTIQNELQSMTADQRQTQAMNLLLYGSYTSSNTKTNTKIDSSILYSFLESQINSLAAKYVRGVDLSFGINQYDKSSNGTTSTTTSYSYQVSKTLFNNRFKVQVGGNYSTDVASDESLAENLFSDVSVEYILKQSNTTNMSVRLFRHIGYESVLEGEITQMGAGFVMTRRLENLKSLFKIRWGNKKNSSSKSKETKDSTATDSAAVVPKNNVIEVSNPQ